ncbi:Carbonic anhydrase [Golovinomyces cichoracearum]|uniref:Carbonic anhydrase n=1 Tax=Golovinomyces cichoracearum TaxID=62708 RepID=A0A420J8T5_9PEZI|nr:Carbonic anhydrase [Golovinomyces cichoracearum]
MVFFILCLLSLALQSAFACPEHVLFADGKSFNKRLANQQDWSYDKSYDWGKVNPNYFLCQIGTTQSPIRLSLNPGLSRRHPPTFSDSYASVTGSLYNWGYGAAFTLDETNITARPSLTYDNTKLYLKGWHIHSPADHSVSDYHARCELHLVHSYANGDEAGVIAILIDPGLSQSEFFSQFTSPGMIPSYNSSEQIPSALNIALAISEVNGFHEFWTYSGSLTSPPCTEGIRFWVGRNTLFVSTPQLQELLRVSTFSARPEQSVWAHEINS